MKQTKEIVATKVKFVKTPPLPPTTSPFKTMEEWLSSLCDTEKPQKSISIYHFKLLESENNAHHTLMVFGTNETRVEHGFYQENYFNPATMYYPFQKNEFENHLTREEVLNRVTSQIKAFTNTTKFRNCFFASAKYIITEYNGETVWRGENL